MWRWLRGAPNPGLIWLDERSAKRVISAKVRGGEVTGEEEQNLLHFARDGYFIIRIELTAAQAADIDRDVDRLWDERPANVAFAYDSPPRRFSDADPGRERKPRYRIHELQTVSEEALRLYLQPLLHRYASLILGETAVATQSLYFEYGSQQALHRDSTVVPTPRFGRLVAAWIALEDIVPESGPLAYVPGSQRFPFYDFSGGNSQYTYDPTRHTAADVGKAMAFYDAELHRSGLPTRHFLAKRGDVLIWHSALMHGGALPYPPPSRSRSRSLDETRTRKSLVVHYSTLASHPTREGAVREIVDGQPGESVFSTTEITERDGAYGFANPLEGRFLYRR